MIGRYGLKSSRKARSFRSQHVVYSKAYTDAKTITFPFPPLTCSLPCFHVSHGNIPSQRTCRDAINELPAGVGKIALLVKTREDERGDRRRRKEGRMKEEKGKKSHSQIRVGKGPLEYSPVIYR